LDLFRPKGTTGKVARATRLPFSASGRKLGSADILAVEILVKREAVAPPHVGSATWFDKNLPR
jgi:hypothetical protein